jgi:hypothetical protein
VKELKRFHSKMVFSTQPSAVARFISLLRRFSMERHFLRSAGLQHCLPQWLDFPNFPLFPQKTHRLGLYFMFLAAARATD